MLELSLVVIAAIVCGSTLTGMRMYFTYAKTEHRSAAHVQLAEHVERLDRKVNELDNRVSAGILARR